MTRPTITGIMPLRNCVRLGYPYRIAIRSLQRLCDDVVIGVDPMSDDATMAEVQRLCDDPVNGTPTRILESVWDMGNHQGHTNCEISVQTQKLCDAATGDWVFSLQADEVLPDDARREAMVSILAAMKTGHTAVACKRIYFYGSLSTVRDDWTFPLRRLFRRGFWRPDVDGAMNFDPVRYVNTLTMGRGDDDLPDIGFSPVYLDHSGGWYETDNWGIFHYSRIGDPQAIAERVRNLDGFFHAPAAIEQGAIAPYDFSELRKLDTYVKGAPCEVDPAAVLVPFDVSRHPAEAREFFRDA